MENDISRELKTTTMLHAPDELAWEMWTNPEHLINWWGPSGFTSTIHHFDLRDGGEWLMTMHGPDGTNYPNRSVFKEIVPFRKIVFEHFNPHFITTVLFTPAGEETQLDWTMLFDSPEMRETIVKAHKADEGQQQNIEKLKHYLLSLQGEE